MVGGDYIAASISSTMPSRSGRHVMRGVRLHSERVNHALLLAAVGGFLDAYTFVGHGGGFANAQTGNIVIFWRGCNHASLAFRRFASAGDCRLPARRGHYRAIGAAAGPWHGQAPHSRGFDRRNSRSDHPRCTTDRSIACACRAFVASLQVSTFRKVGDTPHSSTLTTANLRDLVTGAFAWLVEHKSAAAPRPAPLGRRHYCLCRRRGSRRARYPTDGG